MKNNLKDCLLGLLIGLETCCLLDFSIEYEQCEIKMIFYNVVRVYSQFSSQHPRLTLSTKPRHPQKQINFDKCLFQKAIKIPNY